MLLTIGLSVLKGLKYIRGLISGGFMTQDSADLFVTQDGKDFFIEQDQ
jgi:hypothetical protein